MRKSNKYTSIIIIILILSCTFMTSCKNDRIGENIGRLIKGLSPFDNSSYDSLPEKWQNESVRDNAAAKEAIEALLSAAENDDRVAFGKNFTQELQRDPGFDKAVNNFFEAYPKGLAGVKRDYHTCSGGGSYNYGHNVLDASTYLELNLNGEWYHVSISFCYENTDEPDKVGVTHFTIMNLEGRAVYLEEYNRNPSGTDDIYLLCSNRNSDNVSARMIYGTPYLWTPTDTPKLTEDEMRSLLTQNRNFGIAKQTIGEPNASFKMFNSSGYDYYYELKTDNSEPLYAHICTSSPEGYIIDAYICDADSQDYDNPLAPWIKPEDR